MKKIELLALDAVQPGMKVAEAVLDKGGNVLVPADAEVSEAMLAGLARREIEAIKVEREVEEDPAAHEAHATSVAAKLDRLFRQAGVTAETRTLYQAVLHHRMENSQ